MIETCKGTERGLLSTKYHMQIWPTESPLIKWWFFLHFPLKVCFFDKIKHIESGYAMGGITMWIILGALVGVVAIFLVVASVLDKKKQKKRKAELKIMEKAKEEAAERTMVFLMLAIEKNKEALKSFVPSVGKVKMGDIRKQSKAALSKFMKTNTYTFIKTGDTNKKIFDIFKLFNTTNSNIWESKLDKEIKYMKKKYPAIPKDIKEVALEDFKIDIYGEKIERRHALPVVETKKPKAKKGKK